MSSALLPRESTRWEAAVADALNPTADLVGGIAAIRGSKLASSPPSSFLPFLVYEYGLGELTPYVPSLYQLINQGIRWQRVRGTPSAIAIGIGWLGYSAGLEEASVRRRWWNSFQLRFTTLPADADLDRLAGIARLSVPIRSTFRRGVYYYDVPPLRANVTRLNRALYNFESGIRVHADGPLWSLGRPREISYTLLVADGLALGNWQDPAGLESLTWDDMNFPWEAATFPWAAPGAVARAIALASWFNGRSAFVCFRSADGVVGYREARAARQVDPSENGHYQFGTLDYAVSANGQRFYIEALTGFGDGQGQQIASVSLVIGATRAAGVPVGKRWLGPGELVGGHEFIATAASFKLRATVRERVKFMIRF